MNKVVLYMLVLVVLVAVGCGGQPTTGSGSPDENTASSGGGEKETLDPCALLTDAQVEAAIGAPVAERTSGQVPGALSCDYMADAGMAGPTPHLTILAYTDQTLAEFEDVGTGTAPELNDYAVFSLSITLGAGEKGMEKERMRPVAEQIVAAMP